MCWATCRHVIQCVRLEEASLCDAFWYLKLLFQGLDVLALHIVSLPKIVCRHDSRGTFLLENCVRSLSTVAKPGQSVLQILLLIRLENMVIINYKTYIQYFNLDSFMLQKAILSYSSIEILQGLQYAETSMPPPSLPISI